MYIGNPRSVTEKYLKEAYKVKEKWSKMITQKDERETKEQIKQRKDTKMVDYQFSKHNFFIYSCFSVSTY